MNLSYYMIKDSMFGVKNCIISFLLLVGFAACQQETLVEATKGGFKVSLVDEQVMVETKATSSLLESPLVENFNLRIERNGSDQPLYNGKITNDLIPAPVGVYTLTASYGENPVLGLDAPYYEGKSEVTIESNKTTPVEIPCKVANALVSVDWANEAKIQKIFPGCKVIVAVGNVSVAIGSENKASRVYFRPNSNLSFTFEWTVNGETKSQVLKSDKLPAVSEAGKHYIIKLDVSDDLTLQITKVASRSETITATIPMEWLPKPKVNGFNDQQGLTELVYTETSDAIPAAINFTAASVIQDVEFTLNFADENLTSLNKKYILSTLSAEDRSALVTAGIELPTLIGSNKSGSINFTNMTAKLLTNAGAEVVNEIKVRVKANNRWNVEESAAPSYKITTVKPEFSIDINENDFWAKEFSVRSLNVIKGNLEKLNMDVRFQYSSDEGKTWNNFNQKQTHVFSLLPNVKKYKVRAFYREGIFSAETNVCLENADQLPNSNMEEWHYESYKNKSGIVTYFPWNSNENSFWNTNNEFTTRYRQATFAKPYNSFPAVSYIVGKDGNKAVELRNTASGRGNSPSSYVARDVNMVAGILFTGDFRANVGASTTDDWYERTNGKPFSSRPTGMKFKYKYNPLDGDSWKAKIELWDNNKNVIIKDSIISSELQKDVYKNGIINLNYKNDIEYSKCHYIYIVFSSTITEGANMKVNLKKSKYSLWVDNTLKTYTDPYVGSVLTIDDIELIYDK